MLEIFLQKNRIHSGILKFFLPATLFLTLNSCEKLIYINEGKETEKVETYDYFSQLTFNDIFEVVLKTDKDFSVRLSSPEKFIENISIRENSGELVFSDKNFSRWLPDYPRPKVVISFPRLDKLILTRSSVKLSCSDTLKLRKLELILLGETGEYDLTMNVDSFIMTTSSDNIGYYVFKGIAGQTDIWLRGSSQVEASGLKSMYCKVYNNSVGDCYINVSNKIEVRLNSIGNVVYSGNPKEIIIIEQSSSGRLLSIGN